MVDKDFDNIDDWFHAISPLQERLRAIDEQYVKKDFQVLAHLFNGLDEEIFSDFKNIYRMDYAMKCSVESFKKVLHAHYSATKRTKLKGAVKVKQTTLSIKNSSKGPVESVASTATKLLIVDLVEGHPEVGTQTVDKETTGIWIRLATIVTKRDILQLIVIPKVAVTKGTTERKKKRIVMPPST
jgi:hypothetical protein